MNVRLCILGLISLLGLAPGLLVAQDYEVGQVFSDPLRSGGTGPQMVVVPGGRFVMGGGTVRKEQMGLVKIDYRLGFGVTEVTLGQYRHFLKTTHSGNLDKLPKGGDDLPVTNVSWDDAEAYVNWLSRETGHYYRLPSTSEWEYAARAGGTGTYSWGDAVGENMANCLDCEAKFNGNVAAVKSFEPNAWGLYDMHGNVWEWTKDCIDPNAAPPSDGAPRLFGNCEMRELRGGSAESDAWSMRASASALAPRKMRNNDVGFRVVMDLP